MANVVDVLPKMSSQLTSIDTTLQAIPDISTNMRAIPEISSEVKEILIGVYDLRMVMKTQTSQLLGAYAEIVSTGAHSTIRVSKNVPPFNTQPCREKFHWP